MRQHAQRLVELLGGTDTVRTAVDRLYQRLLTDPDLLSYFEDVKQVDPKKFPTFKPGQTCANCLQLTGKVGDEWRPCNLFPGKLVHTNGWCKVYVKKP